MSGPLASPASLPTASGASLRAPSLLLLRGAWLALFGLTLTLFALAVPAQIRQFRQVCATRAECTSFQLLAEDARALESFGLSTRDYAVYAAGITGVVLLISWILAAVIFWRRSVSRMAILGSFGLLLLGPTLLTNLTGALVRAHPGWLLPAGALEAVGTWLWLVIYYLFPDGRFVPRWARPMVLVIAGYAFVASFPAPPASSAAPALSPLERPSLTLALLLGLMASGLAAQVYRYQRVSGPVERQQTRWVVLGIAGVVVQETTYLSLDKLFPSLRQPGLPDLLYKLVGGSLNMTFLVLFMLTLGISILRYRLWEIDVVVRRTLTYGALTAALGLLYFASVALLQAIFRNLTGQEQNQLVIVLSTLVIAALFAPLRRRVQNEIDRRFFRRRYDAAQVLAAFGAAVREEVDLERLKAGLLSAVQETVQPAHLSLWLSHLPQRGRSPEDDQRAAG